MKKATNLNSPISLPKGSGEMKGGTNGALDGASQAALERGFQKVPQAEDAGDGPGSFSTPMPVGFLGRPRGWER